MVVTAVMVMFMMLMTVVMVVVMVIMQMAMAYTFTWTTVSYRCIRSSPQLRGAVLLFCLFLGQGHRQLSSWLQGRPTAEL